MVPKSDQPPSPSVRKGQGNVKLSRDEFARRLGERFFALDQDQAVQEEVRNVHGAW